MNQRALNNKLLLIAPIAWAAFSALFINTVFTVEWSYPYCNIQDDGPAYAAFGFPLPFMQFGGVSSLEYLFMPLAYFINLLLLGWLFHLLFSVVFSKLLVAMPFLQLTLALTGLILLSAILVLEFLRFLSIYAYFVLSLGDDYLHYLSYRPVAISVEHYSCQPSEYWFGPVRGH